MTPAYGHHRQDEPAESLLRVLSGLHPAFDERSYRIIQDAPAHYNLRDIARILALSAENDSKHYALADVRGLLEHRIENFCLCLNIDDANDFREMLGEELDVRIR